MLNPDDKPIAQDINVVMKIRHEEIAPGKSRISIPKEMRLTEEAFGFIHRMVAEQGFELIEMNIAEVHREEAKDLPNVAVVGKATD